MARTVHIRQAERSIDVPDGRTVLEVALEEGLSYPHGCKSGRCGSCKSRLLSGEVDLLPHTPFALSPEERSRGFILACRAQPLEDCEVAWLGKGQEVADHPVRELTGRVTRLEDATHDIKRVGIGLPSGEPFAFSAGQYAEVTFPGVPTRDYSMAVKPGEPEIEFHVRRISGGATSEPIASNLAVGDAVTLRGPFGDAFLRERHTGPILAIAGGSGLAPVKSIVETALAHGLRQPIHLYFGVRRKQDLYLVEHFERLAWDNDNLSFVPVLSRETGETCFRTGYVGDAVAADWGELDGWKAYMAGAPGLIDSTGPLLLERGVRHEDIHADVFFKPEEDPRSAVAAS